MIEFNTRFGLTTWDLDHRIIGRQESVIDYLNYHVWAKTYSLIPSEPTHATQILKSAPSEPAHAAHRSNVPRLKSRESQLYQWTFEHDTALIRFSAASSPRPDFNRISI